jgi:hypothetical protein
MQNLKSEYDLSIYMGGKMRLKILLVSLLMLLLIGLFPSLANAECRQGDTGVCDTVRIGCPFRIATVPGDSIMVPIYVWNDEILGGFCLGFAFDSTELEIVSKKTYDTTGSAIPVKARLYISEKITIPGQYLIGWVDFTAQNPIPVNTTDKARLLITIKLKVKSTATPMTIVIDSAFVSPAGKFMLISDLGFSVCPQFVHCPEGDIILGDTPCGDVDGSGNINIADIVYMVNYIFKHGSPPQDASGGDVDCDLSVTIADVVYFINYIFRGGPQPCFECW